jgi:hypothetical protein
MAEVRKITRNENGLIIMRDGEDQLIRFFDPAGMIVDNSPRTEGMVSISKTPSNQDDQEAIEFQANLITQIGDSDNLAEPSVQDVKEQLALLFNVGGGSGFGATETAIGVYKAFVDNTGGLSVYEVENTIGEIDVNIPSGSEFDFNSSELFSQGKTAVMIGSNYNASNYAAYCVDNNLIHCSGLGDTFYIEIKIYA